jgi:hypothetical protein
MTTGTNLLEETNATIRDLRAMRRLVDERSAALRTLRDDCHVLLWALQALAVVIEASS